MNTPNYLGLRNRMALAAWSWRWHLQGGGNHWTARDLQDLRNDEDLKRYRATQFALWRARRELLDLRVDSHLPAFLRRQAE